MTEIATLLHISDLHFNSDLLEGNKSVWVKLPLLNGLAAHDFQKVATLATWLSDRKISGAVTDLVLATGDICTDGSTASLETALEFIESANIYKYKPPQWVAEGLGVSSQQRIIVPGNHDRYLHLPGMTLPLQVKSDALERVFFDQMPGYPYVVGYRRATQEDKPENPALLFFVFDSTASKPTQFKYNPAYLMARGYIHPQAFNWLRRMVNWIRANRVAPSIDGTTLNIDYDNAIRIAVLHHHPISTATKKEDAELSRPERIAQVERDMELPEPKDKLKYLENYREFLQACADTEMHVVLFGHQHVVFSTTYRSLSGPNMHFFCCPSTTQLTSEESGGFYLFKFDQEQFNVDYYKWDKKLASYEIDVNETNNPYKYRE